MIINEPCKGNCNEGTGCIQETGCDEDGNVQLDSLTDCNSGFCVYDYCRCGNVARWLGRIGLVVAFFGAVQLALGFKQDDADGKIRGMKTLASGFLVFGITQSLSLFGL